MCWLILRDGQPVNPVVLTHRPGRGNHCHTNSAFVWEAAPDSYRIQTGFGMRGGVWRRHTWLLDREGLEVRTAALARESEGASQRLAAKEVQASQ